MAWVVSCLDVAECGVAACVGLRTAIFWVDAQHSGLCAGWALLPGCGAWAAVVVSGLCGLMDRSCGL